MADQFKFDDLFQDSILAHFVREPAKFSRYGDVLQATYFQGIHATVVAQAVLTYLKEHGSTPGWEVLRQLSIEQSKKLGLGDPEEVVGYIERLRELETRDADYVSGALVAFARERATVNAIKKSVELLREGKTPEAGFVKLFQDAVSVGQDLDNLGYILHADYEQIINKVTSATYGTPTGFPQYDKIWKRGWGPGWLIVFLAPPKRFKTVMMINLALNVIGPAIGGDVLYYSCEITQELAVMRMLSNVSQRPLDDAYTSPEKFKISAGEAIHQGVAGNLLVKGYAVGEASVSGTIRSHARTAVTQLNLKPKMIIIDYADTVRSGEKHEKDYLAQAAVYKEARALGAEFNCPVVMPDRCTKEATDKRVPDMKAFQGAFAKGGIVDVAVGLCMTDDEYADHILRSFVFLNRHGPAFSHFRGRVDPEVSMIDIGEEIPYEPEESDNRRPRRRSDTTPPELQEG